MRTATKRTTTRTATTTAINTSNNGNDNNDNNNGKMKNNKIVQGIFWPGLMSQYLTTREPEQRHVEVSMLSLQAVIEAELTGKLAQSVEELDSDPRGMPVTTGTPATP
jgi:hypothetical protein